MCGLFFVVQTTAYGMPIRDRISDVCSSDLVYAIVADFERQVRNRRIEVEQPRHVGLGFERDVPEISAGHDELPGAGAIIEAHGMGHPVIELASALVAKQ